MDDNKSRKHILYTVPPSHCMSRHDAEQLKQHLRRGILSQVKKAINPSHEFVSDFCLTDLNCFKLFWGDLTSHLCQDLRVQGWKYQRSEEDTKTLVHVFSSHKSGSHSCKQGLGIIVPKRVLLRSMNGHP